MIRSPLCVDPIERLDSDEERRRALAKALRFGATRLGGDQLRKLQTDLKDLLRRYVPVPSNGDASGGSP